MIDYTKIRKLIILLIIVFFLILNVFFRGVYSSANLKKNSPLSFFSYPLYQLEKNFPTRIFKMKKFPLPGRGGGGGDWWKNICPWFFSSSEH